MWDGSAVHPRSSAKCAPQCAAPQPPHTRMITVHHLNNSRSQRVLWLLEELGLPYEIKRYERDPKTMLAPPALRAGACAGQVAGDHRWRADAWPNRVPSSSTWWSATVAAALVPRAGTPERLRYRYWLHFAEGSAMPPLLLKLVFDRIATAPMPFFVRPIAKAISGNVQRPAGHAEPETPARLHGSRTRPQRLVCRRRRSARPTSR